jgi:hypothetical protein
VSLMIIFRFITYPKRVWFGVPSEGGTPNSKIGGPVAFSMLKNKLSDWQSDEPESNRHHNL